MNLEAGRFWEQNIPPGVVAVRPKDLAALLSAARPWLGRIEIIVFGSRAMGGTVRSSDLDLAIDDRALDDREWFALVDALEESPVPYVLDIVRLSKMGADNPVLAEIRKHGVRIWSRDGKGGAGGGGDSGADGARAD